MILLPDRRNWHAITLAHRIHEATACADGTRALSIGVTETHGTEHRQALVRQADLALYEAKRAKLAVVPYRPGLDPRGPKRAGDGASTAAARPGRGTRPHRRRTGSRHEQPLRDGGRARASRSAEQHGIDGGRLERLRVAALLHDVGKIAVPDAILHKASPLATNEQVLMREHVAVGHDILVAAGFVDRGDLGAAPPRALRRHRLPGGPRRRRDPARVADHLGRGRVRGDDGRDGPIAGRSRPTRRSQSSSTVDGTQFDASCVRAVAEVIERWRVPVEVVQPALLRPGLGAVPAERILVPVPVSRAS